MALSPNTRRDIFKQESENTDIVLLTIRHSTWKTPIRLSSSATRTIVNGLIKNLGKAIGGIFGSKK